MASPLSPVCQKIANQIDGLKQEKQALANDLSQASPTEKPFLANEIKALNTQISAKQKALQKCIKEHPVEGPPANPCLPLKNKLEQFERQLDKEIRDALAPLQEELKSAAPGQKSFIIQQIKKTRAELQKNSPTAKKIAAQRKAYFDCLTVNGLKLPLDASFSGKATLNINISGKTTIFNQNINLGLHFKEVDHREVRVTSFPSLHVSNDTPIGEVKTTISSSSGFGKFDPVSQSLTMQLSLFFDHDSGLAGDSSMDITLNSVAPMSAGGDITVSGSSKFKGGFLDGDTCSMTVVGKISPHP
ncbi:hypothetical protein ACN28E_32090 [Archangium lansingense]|uniref:hypothetical protein n=1 Tax=Archangium lansingense TaxID=2995310 RepID=UPI003B825CDF